MGQTQKGQVTQCQHCLHLPHLFSDLSLSDKNSKWERGGCKCVLGGGMLQL